MNITKKKRKTISIVLYEPRIPQNTGNIARTCAGFAIDLHLIKPLGFSLEDRYLKRAGLDYWKFVNVKLFSSFSEYKEASNNKRIIAFSKSAVNNITNISYTKNEILLFGREDTGLPLSIRQDCYKDVQIPMPGKADTDGLNGVRSLNLSVACGIACFVAINS